MKTLLFCVLVLLLSNTADAQSSSPSIPPPSSPQIVEVPSGTLHLRAYFWKPAGPGPFPAVLFNHGSGAADAQHTAGQTMAEAAETLAPLFLKMATLSFIFAGGARVFPPTKARLRKTF